MKNLLKCIFTCTVLMGAGCSSSKPVRIPNPQTFELKGNEYFLVLKNGKTYPADGLKVSNDSVYFEKEAVHFKEIKRIETRAFSPLKTLGLIGGIVAATATIASAYIYYLVAYERSSEK